ncbi:MAG: class I SAM-dependent methyltransferase [Deltaproteobacteria bacterium]|nr:class I SAM-dependent methyltransferase [Deltaproteobacteria bacterium]
MTVAKAKPGARTKSAFDIRFDAQKIAFAPLMFQAARLLRDFGVLKALEASKGTGLTPGEVAKQTNLSHYGARVLLEAGLSMDLVEADGHNEARYSLSKTGWVLEHDEMTRVNMDFVQDVCYRGAFFLRESFERGRPAGLEVFGEWPTVYEALSQLPAHVQKSWFAFDHYYSDPAFQQALPRVFADKPKRLLDVGANTGKFAVLCAKHDPLVAVTILDLPGQLAKADANVRAAGLGGRVVGHPLNLLDHATAFPEGFDAVWMSQFLCCFPESDVVQLIRRAGAALAPGGSLWILDTYWDEQENTVATYCLHASSLYFTCIANGTSRMYHSDDMRACVREAGLRIVDERRTLGISHTLFQCQKA